MIGISKGMVTNLLLLDNYLRRLSVQAIRNAITLVSNSCQTLCDLETYAFCVHIIENVFWEIRSCKVL